jgi:hypothetical protein
VFHPGEQSLDEFGVDADYRETWLRMLQRIGPTSAWRTSRGPAGFGKLLLVAGGCIFYLGDRGVALPAAQSLADRVDDPAAPAALDMELSMRSR